MISEGPVEVMTSKSNTRTQNKQTGKKIDHFQKKIKPFYFYFFNYFSTILPYLGPPLARKV